MTFKKILLATAITAISSSAFAMEAMDEASLSATTGQDGLTISIDNATGLAAMDVIIHDKDGFGTVTNDGAMYINDITVSSLDLTLEIDAGSTAAGSAGLNTLQIKAYNGAMTVDMGTLQVANSARDVSAAAWGIEGTAKDVLDLGSLSIGATTSAAPLLNIQMGNEAQGAWMKLNPTFSGGLTITGMKLYDGSDATPTHGVGIDTLTVTNATGTLTDLNASIDIDADATGLVLGVTTLGTGGMNVRMAGVRLGAVVGTTSPAIGDVEILGLNLNGTDISVIGH